MKSINLFFGEIGDTIRLNVMPWESESALTAIRKVRKEEGKKRYKTNCDNNRIKNIKVKNGFKSN